MDLYLSDVEKNNANTTSTKKHRMETNNYTKKSYPSIPAPIFYVESGTGIAYMSNVNPLFLYLFKCLLILSFSTYTLLVVSTCDPGNLIRCIMLHLHTGKANSPMLHTLILFMEEHNQFL